MSTFNLILKEFGNNWQLLTLFSFLSYAFILYLNRGLNKIPGPFAAKFSNLWRFLCVRRGDFHLTNIRLHKIHGQAVRIGPNIVSISDPAAIKTLYGFSKPYQKSSFYDVWTLDLRPPGLFQIRDEQMHSVIRKPVASAYSMTSLVNYEPLVDETITYFLERLESEFADEKVAFRVCDIDQWLQYYAYDVIGQITWGKMIGFLEKGADVEGTMEELDRVNSYCAVIGQMPFLDRIFRRNNIVRRFGDPPGIGAFFVRMANSIIEQRKANRKDISHNDFLSHFLDLHEVAGKNRTINYLMANIIAGSDTTAISLRAIFYHVLKNPDVLEKLRKEIDGANLAIPVSWAASQKLPYLGAVVKEALRFHPAVGLPLERIVPASGLRLSNGEFIRGGAIVGMNAWVVHRDHKIFGEDAEVFNPQRWLRNSKSETVEEYEERVSAMKRVNLTFGGGTRTCIGKNISLLEIYKVVPTFFLKFDVNLVDAAQDWTTFNAWFVKQSNMKVRLGARY